jgi:Flp pilus assembly protein TadG
MIDRQKWRLRLKRFARDEQGVTAIYIGLTSTVLIGGLALASESGFLYQQQRKLQHAADVAAYAAGTRKAAGENAAKQKTAALGVVQKSDFSTLTTSNIMLNDPPTSGSYTSPGTGKWAIEVTLEKTQPRLLSSIFVNTPYTLRGRAVVLSEGSGGTACVLGLNSTKVGAVTVSGNGTVTLDKCEVASNSDATNSFDFVGASGIMKASCARAVGTVDPGKTEVKKGIETKQLQLDCKNPLENAAAITDPYANKFSVPSYNCNAGSTTYVHCGGWTPTGTIPSGVHVISGGKFKINSNALVSGSGVTFVLVDGAEVEFNGTATINLTAPTADNDPYKGLLFWAPNGQTQTHVLNGNNASKFNGAIYAPSGKLHWNGNGGETGCPQLVADTIEFQGSNNTYIKIDGSCANNGTTPIYTGSKLSLVE